MNGGQGNWVTSFNLKLLMQGCVVEEDSLIIPVHMDITLYFSYELFHIVL
jgi:hypothetical protein